MAIYDLTSSIPVANILATGDILNCPYSGTYKSITLPKGKYKLEVWGAQGGYRNSSTYGGKGGYSKGTINLEADTIMYLYSGGFPGSTSSNAGSSTVIEGGFNGGGSRYGYYGGGGGSDIRIGSTSLYARVIVAGGGGSDGATKKEGMYGGGTTGGSASQNYGSGGGGGTQTAGGTGGNSNSGSFGIGGQGLYRSRGYAGAGGGGWYGGGGSYPDSSGDDDRGGGGGSGYIYTSSTASNYPSGCLLNSSYYLTDASMIAGSESMTSPTGSSETGHSGHGYVRITVIEIKQSTKMIFNNEQIKYLQLGDLGILKVYSGSNLVFNGSIIPTSRNLTIKYSAASSSTSLPSVYVNNSQVLALTESNKEYTVQINSGSIVSINSSGGTPTDFTTAINSNDKNTYPYWSPSTLLWNKKVGTNNYYFTMPNEDVYIYGYLMASSCFVAGTQIFMADNSYKNIEDIHIGDVVYCYNEKDNNIDSAVVDNILTSEQNLFVNIELENNESFICTGMHPIYSETYQRYVNANELKVDDILKTNNGSIKIKSISTFNDKKTVYNMTVSNYHNYFVTKSNVLVHNKS